MTRSGSFRDLAVWEKSHQLVLIIYNSTISFPKEERYGLISQMRRAATSIPANIAEGYKRTGNKDKIRFYNIAQSSLEELRYFLILSRDLNFKVSDNAEILAMEVSKMLEAYIKRMKESTQNRHSEYLILNT
jgi:four helix bundle protein